VCVCGGGGNIKMNIREILYVDWIELTDDRVQLRAFLNVTMNFRVP
jgi:hypothetical protein